MIARLTNPTGPEDWTDIIAAIARRTRRLLDQRGTTSIDEAAIVRNFAEAVRQIRIVVVGFVGPDGAGGPSEDWARIREHIEQAAAGLAWIAEVWI